MLVIYNLNKYRDGGSIRIDCMLSYKPDYLTGRYDIKYDLCYIVIVILAAGRGMLRMLNHIA